MAAPNIIPMADIMLVLLIIFMVVTPMLTRYKPVDLAKVANPINIREKATCPNKSLNQEPRLMH
jgi:biopolymer transport protein ExbD